MSNTRTGRPGLARGALALLAACAPGDRTVGPATAPRPIVASATLPAVRFSELHYDNTGTDTGERIEISGPAGTALAGYQVVLYNGSNGAPYGTQTLSGTVPATCGARGVVVLTYPVNGIQNGDPDGLALVDPAGQVIEFLSYEGTFAAVGGPANGMTSTDIGVAETASTPVGFSLARTPAGTWSGPAANTFGACNDGDRTAPPAGPVTRVTVTPATATVTVGATVTLAATGTDSAGTTSPTTFTWASSDPKVATVSDAGVVTGVAAADAPVTITATAANGVAGTAAVTVAPAGVTTITRVSFSSSATRFPIGFQTQLFATAFRGPGSADTVPQRLTTRRFESLTPDLATIDPSTGIVTGTGAGRPTLRVTYTPTDGGAAFSATYTGITIEARVEADSVTTYGNNLEFGQPGPTGSPNSFLIRRRQFAASYNASRGQPNWVSYEYDSRQSGGEDRCNCFSTDPLTVAAGLPAVTTADYTGSGYSRGHLARSADRTTTNVENASTFYLTNIVPQIQDMNAGPWATLENLLGDSTRAGRAVYIVAGPQFNTPGALRYLNGAGKVAIPDSTWKVALVVGRNADGTPKGLGNVQTWDDLAGVTVIAVMMPNISTAAGLDADWRTYRRTPDQVEAVTGFDVLNLLQNQYEAALEAGDRPPVPVLGGPTAGTEGATLAFNAAGTTDPDAGDVLAYAWSFGDGTMATGASASHAFADDGRYAVTLTVTDRYGWPSTRTQTVTVANAAPVPTLAPAATTVRVGELFTPQAAFTDPGARDATWRVLVAWGDGTSLTASLTALPNGAIRASHTYAAPGTYVVRFTVTDKDGAAASVERTITVTP